MMPGDSEYSIKNAEVVLYWARGVKKRSDGMFIVIQGGGG